MRDNLHQPGGIFSFHPGTANAAFADGSVRAVRSTVSITTLVALITRTGGEVMAPTGY